MYLREVFVLAVAFLVCSQAAVIDRKDPDWVNNLESDKLDDTEIEALSIDDSHTDQDLERELKDIEAKDAAQQKNPSQPTITDVLSRVNEKQAWNNSVEVVEVDIAVGPPSTQDDEIEKKSAIRDLGRIWQDRIVPYVISSAFNKATTDKIKGVMAQYMQKTCLKFVDVTGKTATVKTYLSIEKLSGCWSYVGRYSGAQTLSIGSGCEYDGVIIHEIMHALGFYHEQSRSDRDDFVEIMWENIKEKKESNFKKHGSSSVQTFKTEYDYGSVMHYSSHSFSKNGKATIVPRKQNVRIGQRNGFSNLDLQEINALYQCNKTGGGMSDWSEWSPCLGSGNSMYKERQRFCFETDRSNCSGVNSRGLIFERKSVSCSDAECITKGHWSKWSSWSSCSSTTCSTYGTITRTRACTNPAPKCGGATCPGSILQNGTCYAGNCLGPDDCEFENSALFTCHWKNSTGYPLKWTFKSGGTASSNTGPSGDASKNFNGNGHYMYVEASSPAQLGQKAELCSKEFQGPAKKRFTFKYHSYVTSDTKLTVTLKNATGEEVLWTTMGLEKNEWLDKALTISNSVNVKVCFVYQRGNSWRGDVAIDDLFFKDLDANECSSNPCKNGGACTDGVNSYTCTCASGYTGTNCEININDCSPNPCKNGGACTDGVNSYQCKCAAGFTGATCETNSDDCSPNPCQNGGTCTDGVNSYQCKCAAGYTGTNCETNINDCSPNPCQNGGACTDGVNSYQCTCAAGYTGTNCETNVNECSPNPCQNGGVCTDQVNGHKCTCVPGYTGTNCETNIDECSPNPCQNGGTCTDQVNGHKCTCVPGYTGTNCETNVNECSPNPCQNGGTCTDQVNGHKCTCAPGYTGTNCETNIDDCSSLPCQNGGNCIDGVNSYRCHCFAGFTGSHCEINVNECNSSPCKNGGSCVDGVHDFSCICTAGFTGKRCENFNDCSNKPCKNGGTCTDGLKSYQCKCTAGYTGTNCETNIDDCSSNPCKNGGSCTDGVNSYQCTCAAGYTGADCGQNIDDCSPNPCQNGGVCTDGVNSYQCACPAGYTGATCGININDCNPNPCKNGGTCTDGVNSYQCFCAAGYTGVDCATNIDECSSNPCKNGGTCTDRVNGHQCTCAAGYTGANCETNIDECSSNPCKNGGTCTDRVNGHQCTCAAGYTGANCETNIDECSSNPCKNGGTCTDQVNGHQCTCAAGYTGANCETNVNECSSNPCKNGGTCTDQVNGYQCSCAAGYTGANCETNVDDCSPNRCKNGGSCIDGVNSYQCVCTVGHTGANCETNIDDCSKNPCKNGGSCVDGVNSYQCVCVAGYTGPSCEINIDDCANNPCQNKGSCVDGINDFSCVCTAGFTGKRCENAIPTTTTPKPPTAKPPVFTDSISCDFECGMCAWKQEYTNDTFDWTRKSGRTPSYYTGPSYDHTTAKNGYYIFTESSWPRKRNHNAILYSAKMQSDGQSRCMDFYYHMYGKGIGSLYIEVEYNGTKHLVFQKSGDQRNVWRYGKAKLDVPYGYDFVVYIESVRGSDWRGDTAIDDIRVWKGACSGMSTPSVLACPLERRVKFCDWSQKRGDNGNWKLRKANRRSYGDEVDAEDDGMSANMSDLKVEDPGRGRWKGKKYYSCSRGPRQALSGKRDYFMYFNGRKAANTETAVLQSKAISTSEDTCLRFYAFMCGNNIGSLSVDMVNGVTGSRKELKKISGNQKDHWFETEANIPAGSNFKIELTATQGVKARIVIDDLQVSPGKCQFYKNLFSCNFAGGSCGLTEADDDDCKWKITNSAKGKALQWSINDCDGYSHYHAHLVKEVNVPQRGGCLTIEYNQDAQSNCMMDVLMEDATRGYYGKRQASKRDKIYFSKTKNSKYHTAYVTVPPPRGGCPRRKLYVEVDLEENECERFAITSISWREGICGKR